MQERILPAGHLHRAFTANNTGESLLALGRHAEALAAFTAAESIARAAPTPDHELLGLVLAGKGAALQALQRPDEARAALLDARATAARGPGGAEALAELDARLVALARASVGDGAKKNRPRR
ncbi:tetratricopeptide repeat protein [Nannocystis bainbridge]|uniref:tetratricopeptide repeat protein n=1 Tax=Nannocystis bainbridge TaxID=2995303 RepID=UPI00358DBBC9